MTKLPIDQRCDVARAVLQQPFKYLYGHIILDTEFGIIYWNPENELDQWKALVEWLADNTETQTMAVKIRKAIKDRDAFELERLVSVVLGDA